MKLHKTAALLNKTEQDPIEVVDKLNLATKRAVESSTVHRKNEKSQLNSGFIETLSIILPSSNSTVCSSPERC